MNRALRNRRERRQLVQRWGGVHYYLMAALSRLPDVTGLYYRVCPDKKQLSNYPVGGRVQYRAFFSVTADLAIATDVADPATDVIFRLRLRRGRAIEAYSCFPGRAEVVALARARFVVASGPRMEGENTYVDLVEELREHF